MAGIRSEIGHMWFVPAVFFGVAETPLKASRLLKIQAVHAIIGHTDVNERTKCTEITN